MRLPWCCAALDDAIALTVVVDLDSAVPGPEATVPAVASRFRARGSLWNWCRCLYQRQPLRVARRFSHGGAGFLTSERADLALPDCYQLAGLPLRADECPVIHRHSS